MFQRLSRGCGRLRVRVGCSAAHLSGSGTRKGRPEGISGRAGKTLEQVACGVGGQ